MRPFNFLTSFFPVSFLSSFFKKTLFIKFLFSVGGCTKACMCGSQRTVLTKISSLLLPCGASEDSGGQVWQQMPVSTELSLPPPASSSSSSCRLFLLVPGIESRDLHVLSKHSTTEHISTSLLPTPSSSLHPSSSLIYTQGSGLEVKHHQNQCEI